MAGGSILRRLNDADLDELHQKIRRDAESDLEIARWAEKRLGRPLGNDAAASRLVARYRASQAYQRWLTRWENQDVELRKAIEGQKARLEYLKSLVQEPSEGGLYQVSKHLMARLLTIATEMDDEELKSGDAKWIKGLLLEIREAEKMERKTMADQAAETAGDESIPLAERQKRIREIFQA